MAADVRKKLDAVLVTDERLRVAEPFERLVVACVRHHELVARVAGAPLEQDAFFDLVNVRIEIPKRRKLRRGAPAYGNAGKIGHAGWSF
jgi:hypothetical protein